MLKLTIKYNNKPAYKHMAYQYFIRFSDWFDGLSTPVIVDKSTPIP